MPKLSGPRKSIRTKAHGATFSHVSTQLWITTEMLGESNLHHFLGMLLILFSGKHKKYSIILCSLLGVYQSVDNNEFQLSSGPPIFTPLKIWFYPQRELTIRFEFGWKFDLSFLVYIIAHNKTTTIIRKNINWHEKISFRFFGKIYD